MIRKLQGYFLKIVQRTEEINWVTGLIRLLKNPFLVNKTFKSYTVIQILVYMTSNRLKFYYPKKKWMLTSVMFSLLR